MNNELNITRYTITDNGNIYYRADINTEFGVLHVGMTVSTDLIAECSPDELLTYVITVFRRRATEMIADRQGIATLANAKDQILAGKMTRRALLGFGPRSTEQ